ncbi:Peptidase family M23 [Streptomyces sp. DI166]|nr:peptidoglycan-binding protein [Streptomyces fuscus]SBT95363.1 Peptidase family M23 [Streptomyces sp. DI166]
MSAFTIDMSNPFPSGFTSDLGGPGKGGHQPPDWYIEYGMDLGARAGTAVHAAFDAHVTKFSPHNPSADNAKVYGAQLFMRAPNDMMGGFYTHLTNVPAGLGVGSQVSRGDLLGHVHEFPPTASHLHLALVEIIGGAPDGRYQGVDVHRTFLDTANSGTVVPVTFHQDGSPPTPDGGGGGGGAKVFRLGSTRGVQEALAALGFDPGAIDGLDGPKTRAAVTAFQGSQGLVQDGICGSATRAALAAALRAQGLQAEGG